MKKNYFLTLLIAILYSFVANSQVTELYFSKYGEGSSNNKFLEIYNGTNATIDLSAYSISTCSNGCDAKDEFDYPDNITFTAGTMIAAGDVYVIAHPSADQTILDKADMTFQYLSNGDDSMALTSAGASASVFTIIDIIGDMEAADIGSGWDVAGISAATANHTLTRKSSICGPNSVPLGSFGTDASTSEWIVGDSNSGWDAIGTYTGCQTDPVLTIAAPADGSTISSTTSATISVSVSNFTVGALNGSGVDGHIHWTVQKNNETAVTQPMKYNIDDETITVEPGNSYIVTLELVDNTHTAISPAVTATTTFTVAYPCDIQLGNIASTCDAITNGIDTYSTTIAYTVGNTATYTITAKDSNNNDVGTIGGDNPSNTASGNITISGVPEGTNFTVTVEGGSGSSCDLSRNIYSPSCVSLPIYEPFDYTANSSLIDQPLWAASNTTNLVMVKANDDGNGNPILGGYYGSNELPAFTGNMVSILGGGSDPYIGFKEATSGVVYASFTFHVKDMSSFQDTDGGYFGVLAQSSSAFRSRLWIKDPTVASTKEGLTFNVGLSNTSGNSATFYNNFTANIQEPVFVVFSYDLDTDESKLWVVPDATSFGTNTPPAASLTLTGGSADAINRFILRQDSTNETPSIDFDELRIGTSWADVTSNPVTSVKNNNIEGFTTYPNPVTKGNFVITSSSIDKKQVSIYNMLGKQVFSSSFSGVKSEIDVTSISSGIYILRVTENNKIATKKLVIK